MPISIGIGIYVIVTNNNKICTIVIFINLSLTFILKIVNDNF